MTPGACTQLSTPPTSQQVLPEAFPTDRAPRALYGNAGMALTLATHLPCGFVGLSKGEAWCLPEQC